jgi:hypothetical protein
MSDTAKRRVSPATTAETVRGRRLLVQALGSSPEAAPGLALEGTFQLFALAAQTTGPASQQGKIARVLLELLTSSARSDGTGLLDRLHRIVELADPLLASGRAGAPRTKGSAYAWELVEQVKKTAARRPALPIWSPHTAIDYVFWIEAHFPTLPHARDRERICRAVFAKVIAALPRRRKNYVRAMLSGAPDAEDPATVWNVIKHERPRGITAEAIVRAALRGAGATTKDVDRWMKKPSLRAP